MFGGRCRFAAIVLVGCWVIGCARRTTQEQRTSTADSSRAGTAPGGTGTAWQPSGPPIGQSDTLVNARRPQLAEWETMWSAAMPGFSVDSLWLVRRDRWRPLYERPFERRRESSNDVSFEVMGIRSPDETRTLLVDGYQLIQPEGDSLEVGGEPDSQTSLIDHRTIVETIITQCGPSGGFDWGEWNSATSFALGGWTETDDGQAKLGCLWFYSIPDSTVVEYRTRIVTPDEFSRYQAAWRGWLNTRYRAVRSLPRS
jgi:hypothetical protein